MSGSNEWWRGAVIYQIYPRSFQDDNGDGIGDLKGITRRLGHIAELGADAIWLSPIFTSPMADMGYDVSNYTDIDPLFGTLADFDAMVARAHELGLKVIIDQVLSHSSDRHPFFQESRRSRDNPKADWYVWADPRPDGTAPNNWQSMFGGIAWQWEPRRRQYYLHNFLKEQPDFNFHNPEVREWLLGTMRFWLERGVDGFRLDTANFYFHDRLLRDNPPFDDGSGLPPVNPAMMQVHTHQKNQPENIAFLERIRALLDEYGGRAVVGEIGEQHFAVELMGEYTTGKRLNMAYSFEMLGPKFSAAHFRRNVEEFFRLAPQGWPCWAFSNHDVPRHVTRWAGFGHDQDSLAKLSGALLLSLEGSICLYQGEELGQTETELAFEELTDPQGIAFWPDDKGRDGCRTPMVWSAKEPHAGFSAAQKTWLPVREPQRARAVDAQAGNPDSVLAFYRTMLSLRRGREELKTGRTRFLETAEPVLAFLRGERVLCVFNLSADSHRVDVPAVGTVLLSQAAEPQDGAVRLGPNGFLLAEIAG